MNWILEYQNYIFSGLGIIFVIAMVALVITLWTSVDDFKGSEYTHYLDDDELAAKRNRDNAMIACAIVACM